VEPVPHSRRHRHSAPFPACTVASKVFIIGRFRAAATRSFEPFDSRQTQTICRFFPQRRIDAADAAKRA
jgi:hypothetical protein